MDGEPLGESLITDYRWTDILSVRTTNALTRAYGKCSNPPNYRQPIIAPGARFIAGIRDDRLLLVKGFGLGGLEQVQQMRAWLAAYDNLPDDHNPNQEAPVDNVYIDNEGAVQRVTPTPQVAPTPRLDLAEYQRRAMQFLSDEVLMNSGLVSQRLFHRSAAMMLNAALGLASEAGEVCEIYKKYFCQGHPMDEATLVHLKKETGDVFWYLALQCYSQGWDPVDILQMNIDKLAARYPNGFDTERSINRVPGDV